MPILTKPQLKQLFETGDKPTQGDFSTLIDYCYGADQLLSYNNAGIVKLTNSDGTFQTINLTNLNRQTLSYNSGTRRLTLSGTAALNEVGPLDGVWTESASSIRYSGNVGIGTIGVPAHKLEVNGNTQIHGSLRFGGGTPVNAFSSTVGNTHNAVPTGLAVQNYVAQNTTKSFVNLAIKTGTTYPNHYNLELEMDHPNPLSSLKNNGWDLSSNIFTAPASGRYIFYLNFDYSLLGTLSNSWTFITVSFISMIGGSWASRWAHHRKEFNSDRLVFSAVAEYYLNQNDTVYLQLQNESNCSISPLGGGLIIHKIAD